MAIWSPNYNLVEQFGTRRVTWNRLTPTAFVTLQCPKGLEEPVIYDLLEYHREWPYRDKYDETIPGSGIYQPDPLGGQPLLPKMRVQAVSQRVPKTYYTDQGSPDDPSTPEGERMQYQYTLLDVQYAAEHGFFHEGISTTQSDQTIATWCNWNLYAEETWEPEIRYLTVDHKLLEWNSISGLYGGARMPLEKAEELAVPYRRGKIVRKVSGYTDLNAVTEMDTDGLDIRDWEGSVHKYDYTSVIDGFTYAAGTLFVTSFKFRKTYYSLQPEKYTYTIEAEMTYQKDGWDTFYRFVSDTAEDVSGFYPVWYKNTAKRFNPLQQVDMRMFIFGETQEAWDRKALCPIP